jgi:hypothetical protein
VNAFRLSTKSTISTLQPRLVGAFLFYKIDTKTRQEYPKDVMNTQSMIGAFYLQYKDRIRPSFINFIVRFHAGIKPNSSINDYRDRDRLTDLLYEYMTAGDYTDDALNRLYDSLAQIETLTD